MGVSIFVLCWHAAYIELYELWPFHEHPLKHFSHFCLNLLEINKKYLGRLFLSITSKQFGKTKHLRHLLQIFSELCLEAYGYEYCCSRRFSSQVPSTYAFRGKIESRQEMAATYCTGHLDAIFPTTIYTSCQFLTYGECWCKYVVNRGL